MKVRLLIDLKININDNWLKLKAVLLFFECILKKSVFKIRMRNDFNIINSYCFETKHTKHIFRYRIVRHGKKQDHFKTTIESIQLLNLLEVHTSSNRIPSIAYITRNHRITRTTRITRINCLTKNQLCH